MNVAIWIACRSTLINAHIIKAGNCLATKYDSRNCQVSMLLSRNIRAAINFGDMPSVACHQNLKKIQLFRFPCCSTRKDLSIDV